MASRRRDSGEHQTPMVTGVGVKPSDEKESGEVSWREALASVGLALAIPWMIGMPAVLGWWLDKRYGTWPLWFIVWLLAGLLGAALDIYKLLKRFGQFK